ncbi:hypothetical protein BDR26DRAFT_19047 [Obelidium mucronatum]|nr:hypothetical protein BDR26DRAFT_19047 [Obelidium mucronatum]
MAKHPKIRDLGNGLYNLRAPYHIFLVLNVGTAMSFVKLASGKFVALSTVVLDAEAKAEVDSLTQNGDLIEAVVATNPFHTGGFEGFHAAYPKVPMYGTPRHLRNYKGIPWAGSVLDEAFLKRWSPELELTIPAGCEFDDPQPESLNHFAGVIAFHRASRFLIGDDTFETVKKPGLIESMTSGLKHGDIRFHPLFPSAQVFLPTPNAPKLFNDWLQGIINDWDFDNLATAHYGVTVGGCKQKLREALERARPKLESIARARGGSFP